MRRMFGKTGVFCDGQMYNPARLVLAFVNDDYGRALIEHNRAVTESDITWLEQLISAERAKNAPTGGLKRRRAALLEVNDGVVVPYVHNAAAPGLGKIGVLVALESDAGADVLEPLGKQLAMHIAAAFPQALDADSLDADVLDRERKIAAEKAAETGMH